MSLEHGVGGAESAYQRARADDLAGCRSSLEASVRREQVATTRAEEAEALVESAERAATALLRRVRDLTTAIEDALLEEFDGDARARLQAVLGGEAT